MAVRREHADNMRVKLIAEKATERAALNPASQA
jgi:hypothetical protein